MAATPLTAIEKAWLKKLEKVMSECPSDRLSCYTVGDKDLMFYDKHVAKAWEEANPRIALDAGELHDRAGSYLKSITGAFHIDSCAG